jgi:hypothetical protein
VWTLDEAAFWTKQGLWPIAGNVMPIGLFGGGTLSAGIVNVIDKINITSVGNSTDFGDLTSARYYTAGCSTAHGGL